MGGRGGGVEIDKCNTCMVEGVPQKRLAILLPLLLWQGRIPSVLWWAVVYICLGVDVSVRSPCQGVVCNLVDDGLLFFSAALPLGVFSGGFWESLSKLTHWRRSNSTYKAPARRKYPELLRLGVRGE